MQRLRLYDLRTYPGFAQALGVCEADIKAIADAANSAQLRLLYCKEAGDEGWWGTWAEIAFNVDRNNPLITLPREVARIEAMDVCRNPVPIFNQFYEYLRFGNGRMPATTLWCPGLINVLDRNIAPTFRDISSPPQIIKVVMANSEDQGKRVLIQGLDNNNNTIYTQDGVNRVTGVFVVLDSPFVSCPTQMNAITGIQKDVTNGPVQFFQVNPTTGEEILLLTMQPGETTGWYRRYFIDSLPLNCCFDQVPNGCIPGQGAPSTVQVTAIAKLEFIPLRVDPDYCLLQNPEAILEECRASRYMGMDNLAAKNMAMLHHTNAVRFLNGELGHRLGTQNPSISVKPFGSARLERQKIGTMI